jgi:hypothetical protein
MILGYRISHPLFFCFNTLDTRMKFLPVALAALLGIADAKKSLSKNQLQSRMKKGEFNKSSLMRGAKPYGAASTRKLEDGEAEEWQINGLYSIQFNTCLTLTIQDEDLFGEDYIYYAKQGQLAAQSSYILFDVCYTEDCYYQADDAKMTYITDIASFFAAFSDFLPNQVEEYCNACQENEDYCYGNLDAQNTDDAAADEADEDGEDGEEDGEDGDEDGGDGEDDRRKLSKVAARKLADQATTQYIDCSQCFEYECFENDDEDQDQDGDDAVYEFEDALEWLEGLSECQEIEDATWNDLGLYAGLICNDDGSGVEIGVFVDDACTLYTNQKSYGNIMSYSDKQYYSMSQEVVEFMFTNDFSCYQQEIEYTNPYAEQDDDGDDEEQDADNDGEAPEAAEWCQDLFDGGNMEAVNLYDCGAEDNDDDQQEEAEEDEYLTTYDWYTYQLTDDQLEDSSQVCEYVKALEGEYTRVYDGDASGSLYNYQKANKFDVSSGAGAGAVVGIVILVIVVAAAGAAFAFRGKKSSGGDKKAPLINNGSMA